jgi:pyruvate kinase
VSRQLNLSWGVVSATVEPTESTDKLGRAILAELTRLGLGGRGTRVVITAGLPLGASDSTNVIQVLELE